MKTLRSLFAEPRIPDPPRRVWRDWALLAVYMVTAVLEAIFRDDIVWPWLAIPMSVIVAFTLMWRRSHPLLALGITFGVVAVVDVATIIAGVPAVGLYAMGFLLVLPYTLFRWGSGRDFSIGIMFMVSVAILSNIADYTDIGEVIGGFVVLFFPAVFGATVRFRASAHSRELDQIRMLEREQLARELHDTVAHHVSAIAIQAQAGRAVAAIDPAAALEALRIVEIEASRTLAEMRTMVGVLRAGDEVDLAPQRDLRDIKRLAAIPGDGLQVSVSLAGDLDSVEPAIGAAMYRLAQESITNAARHARNATAVTVQVLAEANAVRLIVSDDGDPIPASRRADGYGIVGMAERVKLLGGTIDAGPQSGRGWMVRAELPRNGVAS